MILLDKEISKTDAELVESSVRLYMAAYAVENIYYLGYHNGLYCTIHYNPNICKHIFTAVELGKFEGLRGRSKFELNEIYNGAVKCKEYYDEPTSFYKRRWHIVIDFISNREDVRKNIDTILMLS